MLTSAANLGTVFKYCIYTKQVIYVQITERFYYLCKHWLEVLPALEVHGKVHFRA